MRWVKALPLYRVKCEGRLTMNKIDLIKKKIGIYGRVLLYTRARYVTLAVLLVILFLSARFFVKSFIGDKYVIAEAFSDTDIADNDSLLELTAYYNDSFLSENDKKEMVRHLLKELGIRQETEVTYVETEDKTTVEYIKEARRAVTTVRLVSLNNNRSTSGHYLLIRLSIDGDSNYDILNYRDKFTAVLEELGVEELYTTIQLSGEVEGRLDIEKMNDYCDSMLEHLDGQVVYDNLQADNYLVYGYTAAFPEYIELQDSIINIQISMKYDSAVDKTYVELATPVSR